MSTSTKIEWTEATWNPVRGCSQVSEGCRNCYAMKQAHRMSGSGGAYEGLTRLGKHGPVWTGDTRLVLEVLDQPLRWQKPRLVFVNSMGDLFHEAIDDDALRLLFSVMATAADVIGHTFQILTKRPKRMREFVSRLHWRVGVSAWDFGERAHLLVKRAVFADQDGDEHGGKLTNEVGAPRGIWLGTSVENQEAMDQRWQEMRGTPAPVLFLSMEPLLAPVKIPYEALMGPDAVGWVIVGGESGPRARPVHPQWARDIRDQCQAAGTPFFFKQWGAWAPVSNGWHRADHAVHLSGNLTSLAEFNPFQRGHPDWTRVSRMGKKWAGRDLDGRTWDELPCR